MVPSKQNTPSAMEKSPSKTEKYLERKYGKEPKISLEELKQIRWNWH